MSRLAQNSLPQRDENELDVGGDAKLGFDEVARIRHRLRAEVKNLGDVLGRSFGEQQAQNLELPRRQQVCRGRRVRDAAQRKLMIDVGAERYSTLQHLECSAHQRFRRAAFGDIAPRPGPDRLHGVRSVLSMVKTRIRAAGSHCRIRLIASTPPKPGMVRSMMTRSGRVSLY